MSQPLEEGSLVLDGTVSAVLLLEDALRDGDVVAREIARRWIGKRKERDEMAVES